MRRLTTIGLVTGALVAGAVLPAAAAAPTIERETIVDTRFFPAGSRCDFDVQGARSGVLTTKTWTEPDGTVRIALAWGPGKITYTNPANGREVTTVLAGPVVYEFRPDGTLLYTVNGNDQHVTAPGLGFLDGAIGHSVTLYDAATSEVIEVLQSAGPQGTPFPAGCAALE